MDPSRLILLLIDNEICRSPARNYSETNRPTSFLSTRRENITSHSIYISLSVLTFPIYTALLQSSTFPTEICKDKHNQRIKNANHLKYICNSESQVTMCAVPEPGVKTVLVALVQFQSLYITIYQEKLLLALEDACSANTEG